jgi:hypothetical protein
MVVGEIRALGTVGERRAAATYRTVGGAGRAEDAGNSLIIRSVVDRRKGR